MCHSVRGKPLQRILFQMDFTFLQPAPSLLHYGLHHIPLSTVWHFRHKQDARKQFFQFFLNPLSPYFHSTINLTQRLFRFVADVSCASFAAFRQGVNPLPLFKNSPFDLSLQSLWARGQHTCQPHTYRTGTHWLQNISVNRFLTCKWIWPETDLPEKKKTWRIFIVS